ncbi:MAG: hypothetical protein AB4063_16965 [Crocosphaera sp.]
MNLKEENPIINPSSSELINTLVKILSTCLISAAIFWELGNLSPTVNEWAILSHLNWIFILDRIALISHGVEGIIAAYYARLQNNNPLQFALYAFFTGTPGLLELTRGKEGQE